MNSELPSSSPRARPRRLSDAIRHRRSRPLVSYRAQSATGNYAWRLTGSSERPAATVPPEELHSHDPSAACRAREPESLSLSPWVAVGVDTVPSKRARELRDAWEDFVDDRLQGDDEDPGTPDV